MSTPEGGSVGRPPLLDEITNFGYWKSRMRAFIKSIDEQAWEAVEDGWEPPQVADTEGKMVPKKKSAWTKKDKDLAVFNSRAINAIFAAMNEKNFKLITNCTSAKKAWEILCTHFEGTSKVKENRLQMITAKFEQLRMKEDESVADFTARLMDVANEAAALGQVMSDEFLVRKTLRSLPKSYNMKVCSITDSNDLSKLSLDDLIGSLRMFELMLNNGEPKVSDFRFKAESAPEGESEDDSLEEIDMLLQKLERLLNKKEKTSKTSSNDHMSRIHCKGCKGYGHFRNECPTVARRKKHARVANNDDSDTDQSEGESEENKLMALTCAAEISAEKNTITTQIVHDSDSEDEPTDEAIAEKYAELFDQWTNSIKRNVFLTKEVKELKTAKEDLVHEVTDLKSQVQHLEAKLQEESSNHKVTRGELVREKKYTSMMSRGSKDLSKILDSQRLNNKGCPGLGYEGQETSEVTKFVPAENPDPPLEPLAVPAPERSVAATPLRFKDTKECNFYKKLGHTQTKCPKFLKAYKKKNMPHEASHKRQKDAPKDAPIAPSEAPYKSSHKHGSTPLGRRPPMPIYSLTPWKMYDRPRHPLHHERRPPRVIPYQQRMRNKVCYCCNKKGHIQRNCSQFLAKERVRRYAPKTKLVWRVKEVCSTTDSSTEVVVVDTHEHPRNNVADATVATTMTNLDLQTNPNKGSGGAETDIETKDPEAPKHGVNEFIELWCSFLR